MRIVSWNINGYSEKIKDKVSRMDADIVALQETRILPEDFSLPEGFTGELCAGLSMCYAGTAALSRTPLESVCGFDDPRMNTEGRLIRTRLPGNITLINAYFPNGEFSPQRRFFKRLFNSRALSLCGQLRAEGREIILCGDFNIARTEEDVNDPSLWEGVSGFLEEERLFFDALEDTGMKDALRVCRPEGKLLTWTSRDGRRSRFDYFMVTSGVKVRDCGVLDVAGSDHLPVFLDTGD